MSLINDALETAQRERSGQVKGVSGSQPLLDGFFPYVSTNSAKGQTNRARVALIAVGTLVVVGSALWFAAPVIRVALQPAPKQTAAITLSPRQEAPAPVVTPARTPDQQGTALATPAETTSRDS